MSDIIQRNFAGGLIGPQLLGRADQSKYASGLKTCTNAIIRRFGTVQNRAGTYFDAEVKDSTKTVRLIEFIYSSTQTYVLEFGDFYMRIHKNGAPLSVGALPAWAPFTTYATGDLVSFGGVNYRSQVDHLSLAVFPGLEAINWTSMPADGSFEMYVGIASSQLPNMQFSQTADRMLLTPTFNGPYVLTRVTETKWILSIFSAAPTIAAPASPTNSGAAGATTSWVVTAIAPETYEESNPSVTTSSSATPTVGSPITVSWTAVAGALEYNVYKATNGIYGFIGTAGALTFVDSGLVPDATDTPPIARDPFAAHGNDSPSVVGTYQQRTYFANTPNAIEKVWASKAGFYKNFSIRSPLQDDDAVTFSIVGNQVNEVRAIVDIGKLIIFTAAGEYVAAGDQDGAITPTTINLRRQGNRGSSTVRPLVVESTALFIQARGSGIRDLLFDVNTEGYRGRDLTVFAPQLFEGFTVVDWAYQQNPNSIIWAVRSDGALLALTYLPEQSVWAWSYHQTDGAVENVCCVPEGGEDSLYLVVRRVINGATKRYVERMKTRAFTDIRYDAFFVDCGLTYDGRNTISTTMTVSGGATWLAGESLTMTASAATFTAGDVGNAIVYRMDQIVGAGNGDVTFTVTAYTDSTHVTVSPNTQVPAAIRGVATTLWSRAVDDLTNLSHLEGKTVSILADGNVPTSLVVTGGAIHLARPASVVHVGLAYTTDIELLDIENVQGETIVNKMKDVKEVTMQVNQSRGLFFGPTADQLVEWKQRALEAWNAPIQPYSGIFTQGCISSWQNGGRVVVRQQFPLPVEILSITRTGKVGG